MLGVGFTVNLRLDSDPDAAALQIRALRFGETLIKPLLAAMQSYYIKHPIGEIRLINKESAAMSDLEDSFFQAGCFQTVEEV
jgi:hypothetical protein